MCTRRARRSSLVGNLIGNLIAAAAAAAGIANPNAISSITIDGPITINVVPIPHKYDLFL